MWSSVMFCCSTSYSCKIVSYLLKFHDSSPTSGHWMNVGRLTSRTRRSHFTACIVAYWSLSYTLITIGFHLLCELQTEPGAKQNVWKLISVSKKNEEKKKSQI